MPFVKGPRLRASRRLQCARGDIDAASGLLALGCGTLLLVLAALIPTKPRWMADEVYRRLAELEARL